MRHAITLAAIPVVVWLAWPAPRSEIVAKTVETEGVRAQRMDAGTFAHRWRVVSELPPALQIHEVSNGATLDRPGDRHRGDNHSVRHSPTQKRIVKRVALRADICARHGMRKVHTGRTWRCRR